MGSVPHSIRRWRTVLVGLACALAIGGAVVEFTSHRPVAITRTTLPRSRPPSRSLASSGVIAEIESVTTAYRSPGGAEVRPIAPSWHGARLYLPVIAQTDTELEVRLPTRPNGSTAWIRRAAVRLYSTPYRIVVDLGMRHVLLYRDARLVLDAPAGIGTIEDPTPVGHFFVAFFAKAPSPAWGPFVLVTSAHSNSISDWEESGDAIVAIHGPLGQAGAIGTEGARISHGCVRLRDGDLARLRVVPAGSPVDIIG